MPCILPVLLLKLATFQGKKESVLFGLGIISVFTVLGALSYFVGLNWGQQFQNNYFVAAISVACFLSAILLADIIILPISMRDWGGGPFVTGIFATLLATPCVGPFMGPVLIYATTKGLHGLYLFLAMGFGMALPYFFSCFLPDKALLKILPKPGVWLNIVKKLAAASMDWVILVCRGKQRKGGQRGFYNCNGRLVSNLQSK